MFVSDNAVGYDLVLHCRKRDDDAGPAIPLVGASVSSVRAFVREQLSGPGKYRVHYLHVARRDELDYRRLFAEWLCDSFSRAEITMDFESFRRIVDEESRTTCP
jgi:hypothetical protein